MAKIIWTNYALDDLRDIYDYVSKDSHKYVDRLMDKIIGRVDALVQNPFLEKKVPEFGSEMIRELIEGNYRIIYKIDSEEQIGIARVHHSARMLKSL